MNKFEKDRMKEIGDNISKIYFPLARWRYLVLFQSGSQAISWIVTLLGSMVLVSYLFSDSKAPLDGLLLGAAIGSSFSLMAVLPAKFTVQDDGLAVLGEIEICLLKINYIEEQRRGKKVIYRQNLPRLLRWDEGNVQIISEGNILVVMGAYMAVRKVRSSLLKDYFNNKIDCDV